MNTPFVAEVGKVFEVITEPIGAWIDYTQPPRDENGVPKTASEGGQYRGESTERRYQLQAGDRLRVTEIVTRVEDGFKTRKAYEVVKGAVVTVGGEEITDANTYYFWPVYEGEVYVRVYAEEAPPPHPPAVGTGVEVEVRAGRTTVLQMEAIPTLTAPPGPGEGSPFEPTTPFVARAEETFDVIDEIGAFLDYTPPADLATGRGESKTRLYWLHRGDRIKVKLIKHRVERDSVTKAAYEVVRAEVLFSSNHPSIVGNLYWFWVVNGGKKRIQPAGPWNLAERNADGTIARPGLLVFLDRLEQIVQDPCKVRQGCLNLCGPAAFVSMWISRDPVSFRRFAERLYITGTAYINGARVDSFEPDEEFISASYADINRQMNTRENLRYGGACPATDWMIMGSIRGGSNFFFDYEGTPSWTEGLSAFTPPGDIESWMNLTRKYKEVRDQTDILTSRSYAHAMSLDPSKTDIALLVNAGLVSQPGSLPFPNHWIVLRAIREDGGDIEFSYWSWGSERLSIRRTKEHFSSNYYGAVVGVP